MTINYQLLQRQRDINTFKNELFGVFCGKIFNFAPPHIQFIYDKMNYNKAKQTLQNWSSTPYEQTCAIKNVIEFTQKYSRTL